MQCSYDTDHSKRVVLRLSGTSSSKTLKYLNIKTHYPKFSDTARQQLQLMCVFPFKNHDFHYPHVIPCFLEE